MTMFFAMDQTFTDPHRTSSAEPNPVSAAIFKDRIARTDRCEFERRAHFNTPLVTQLIFAIRVPKRHPDIVRFLYGPSGASTFRRPLSFSRICFRIFSSFGAWSAYRQMLRTVIAVSRGVQIMEIQLFDLWRLSRHRGPRNLLILAGIFAQ